jgi:hypothetical protein
VVQCYRRCNSDPVRLRRTAPLTCSALPQSRAAQAVRMRDVSATTQRSRDSRLGLDQLRRRSGSSPGQPATHIPADLDRNREGAPNPPRSNAQALDEARKRISVARCRACCSPLGSVVGAGPFRGRAGPGRSEIPRSSSYWCQQRQLAASCRHTKRLPFRNQGFLMGSGDLPRCLRVGTTS